MVEDMAERLRLAFDVDVLRQAQETSARVGYGVTLIRAGNTLHGWRFPAEVLRRAVARFEGSSCFLNHVGWFQQAASVGGPGGGDQRRGVRRGGCLLYTSPSPRDRS